MFTVGCVQSALLHELFSSYGEQGLLSKCGVQASLAAEHRLQGAWAQQLQLPGFRAQVQWLWCMGLEALRHVESSRIRDQTCVSCAGRQILYQ